MKKALLVNTNAGRLVAAIKDDKAIVFTDCDLDKLGVDIYNDTQFNPADFDFDLIIENNSLDSIETIPASEVYDNNEVLKEIELC